MEPYGIVFTENGHLWLITLTLLKMEVLFNCYADLKEVKTPGHEEQWTEQD